MASSILSLAELSSFVETDVPDESLEQILDSVDADILQQFGPHSGERMVVLQGGRPALWLPLPAVSLGVCRQWVYAPEQAVVVEAWLSGPRRAVRTDGRDFLPYVEAAFTPVDSTGQRRTAMVDLVKVSLQYSGLASYNEGETAERAVDYFEERRRIIMQLERAIGLPGMAA